MVIYGVVIAVAMLYKISGEIDLDIFVEDLIAGATIAALFAVFLFIVFVIISRRRNSTRNQLKDFPNAPWLYDRSNVEITGTVELVFSTATSKRLETFFIDTLRSLTLSRDNSGRTNHQKFLLSSPGLRKGERLLIVHNEQFGAVPIKKGAWISVRGEYVHRRSPRKALFGTKLTFYGLVHFTHEPKGFVKPIGRPDGRTPLLIVHSKPGHEPTEP